MKVDARTRQAVRQMVRKHHEEMSAQSKTDALIPDAGIYAEGWKWQHDIRTSDWDRKVRRALERKWLKRLERS